MRNVGNVSWQSEIIIFLPTELLVIYIIFFTYFFLFSFQTSNQFYTLEDANKRTLFGNLIYLKKSKKKRRKHFIMFEQN